MKAKHAVNITIKQLQKIAKIMGYSAVQIMAMVYAYDSYNNNAYNVYISLAQENAFIEEPNTVYLTEQELNYVMLKVHQSLMEKTKVPT